MASIGLESSDLDLSLGNDREHTQEQAMLGALLLGQRDPSFGQVYESFQRVGCGACVGDLWVSSCLGDFSWVVFDSCDW